MSDTGTKIDELPEALTLSDDDLMYVVSNDLSQKITKQKLQEALKPEELTDIRIGADGNSYSSAGNSVRTQVSDLFSSLKGNVSSLDLEAIVGFTHVPFVGNGFHYGSVGSAIALNINKNDSNVAKRCYTELIKSSLFAGGTQIFSTNVDIAFRVWIIAENGNVIYYTNNFVTSYTLPTTINGTNYAYIYIDAKADNNLSIETACNTIFLMKNGLAYNSKAIENIISSQFYNKTNDYTLYDGYYYNSIGERVSNQNYRAIEMTVTPGDVLKIKTVTKNTVNNLFYSEMGILSIPELECTNSGEITFNDVVITVPFGCTKIMLSVVGTYYSNYFSIKKIQYNVSKSFNQAYIANGPTFIFISNDKIHLISGDSARCLIGENTIVPNFQTKTLHTTFESTVLSAVYIDDNYNLGIEQFNNIQRNHYIIAFVYVDTVFSNNPNVICNRLPLIKQYYRQSIPQYINSKRLGYNVATSTLINSNGNVKLFKDTIYMAAPSGNIYWINNNKIPVSIPNGVFNLNSNNIANKVVLMVGDSITNRGWMQRQLLTREPTLVFVGTKTTGQGTGVTDYKCEATPGATAKQMIDDASSIGADYSAYVQLLDAIPDIVTIEFGLNETDAVQYRTYVQLLIDSIKEYDNNNNHVTKIYVLVPFVRCLTENTGHNYTLNANLIHVNEKCTLEAWSLTGCTLIPTNQIFDDRYDYTHSTDSYGYGLTIEAVNDYVHPSEDVGFKKLGDMVYSYLGATT